MSFTEQHAKSKRVSPMVRSNVVAGQEEPLPERGCDKNPARNVESSQLDTVILEDDYRPRDDEPFMNPRHRAYFHRRLLRWKGDILSDGLETIRRLQDDTESHGDQTDRATFEAQRAIELKTRDRQRKLIAKIDAAIRRIHDGTYGYCEETGEPISLKRLQARPIATLSIDAQERHERREKIYRDG